MVLVGDGRLGRGIGDSDRGRRTGGAQRGERPVIMAGAIADAMAAPVEQATGRQEVWVDFRADSSGSRIFIWPGRVGSPGRQRRKVSRAARETVTGSAVAKPAAASAVSNGSVSGSSRIG